MRNRFASVVALFASLAAPSPAAWATPTTYNNTGSLQTFTIPTTGMYDLYAFGAQGGTGPSVGGLGAQMGGEFNFTAGTLLTILVGGQEPNGFTAGAGGAGWLSNGGDAPAGVFLSAAGGKTAATWAAGVAGFGDSNGAFGGGGAGYSGGGGGTDGFGGGGGGSYLDASATSLAALSKLTN